MEMTRKPTPNSRFAKAGVSCFYDSEVLNSSFVHLMKFSAENPRLRKAAKRYRKPYDSANIKQTDMKRTFLDNTTERLTARPTSPRNEVLFFANAHFLFLNFFANAQNTLSFFCHAQTQRRKKMKECFRQRSFMKLTTFEKQQESLWFKNFFTFVKYTK